MMNAEEAIDWVDPQRWAATPPAERLHLLEQVRANLKRFGEELGAADARMKNGLIGEDAYSVPLSTFGTVVIMANTVTAAIDVYEGLVHGEMPTPLSVTNVGDDRYDIKVFPSQTKDRLLHADRTEVLRVKGEPSQVNPMDKPAGIIAVLGAGNYSSSLEMIKALFFENCAVVHKPHHLNAETDEVWAKIMRPLVDHRALAFAHHDQGRALTVQPGLAKIYFTGGTGTAKAIMAATDTPLVSECGGNNPCLIVPGDRPWTEKELTHQAQQIATIRKLNGGAICGSVQTLVTSKHWPQREAFLDAVRKAIVEDTPAEGTYYPGSAEVKAGFLEAYPDAEILEPEGGTRMHAEVVLITGAEEESYATENEAFCQILSEVPLDVPANAADFLPRAVAFCNDHLHGTLGSSILIDEDTKKAHQAILDQAVTDMEYGAVAVNAMPPFVFLSPWLTWGGNEEGKTFVSGVGNFGNAMGFENVEKSILTQGFMSSGHMINTNKAVFNQMATNMTRYAVEPTWRNLTCLVGDAVTGSLKKKDF
ncbi:MAG: aldehyde dehydrogenase family protein [Bacteroidota bacterium]